jgi:hypothetical protein
MNKNAALLKLTIFAEKHGVLLETKGQIGMGRPCVGFLRGKSYVAYKPLNMKTYDVIDGFDDDRVDPPEDVNSYHKGDYLAVLVDDDNYDEALRQLGLWVDSLKAAGEVEIVSYNTGATGMQAMLSGSTGYAVRIK